MSKPTWAARLPGGLAPEAWSFLHSLPHDRFLWPYDCDGTAAHVRGLEAAGVLTPEEAAGLATALADIRDRPDLISDEDEDVHSAIERVLTERLGEVGAKVHAGRSRNDQVVTAMRLWAREQVGGARASVVRLVGVLADRAEEHAETLAPGYTHLQRAQPVTIGHWLCAHAWALVRDVGRLDAAHASADVSPLGAGALATSTLGVDPAIAADALDFGRVFANSIDAVADRDFLADALYACAAALGHLSRLAEEIVLWSSAEFAFVVLPDAYATGSSMMPQKKNPDVPELVRGHAGLAIGALTGLLALLKGLPLAYDRDLQADKQAVRGVLETTRGAFEAMAGLVAGLRFDGGRLAQAASDPGVLATDLAEDLVREGVPFRRAHGRVAESLKGGDGEAADAGRAEASVRRRAAAGGPSPDSVRAQVGALRSRIAQT